MSEEGLNFAAERRPCFTIHTVFFFFKPPHLQSGCHTNASRHFQANQETAHTCTQRERGSTDRQNWRLLDCAQYFEKVGAHSVSIPTGVRRFPIVGERTLAQNWYKLGCGLTLRPDATRAFAQNLQNLENHTIDFRDRPLKQSLCDEQDICHSHFLTTARCALALHSKACVGVAMELPLDTYPFLCGT